MSRILWPRGTLRVEDGTILPAPGELRSPQGSTRIYLLVHGFNNDRHQAETSYQAFRQRMSEIIDHHIAQRLWEFYWPGYEDLIDEPLRRLWYPGLVHSGYTAICYFKQVDKAVTFGKMLGKYLLKLRAQMQATEIVLIGHSLGCRLILEAIQEMMPRTTSSRIPAVLLMAGAVPIQKLGPAGELRPAALFPEQRIVLYSRRDPVLRWAFPPGQILAGDRGAIPEAVGLNGMPRDCWTARDQTMLTHGEYWSHSSTTPNIARLFGKVMPHVLPYSDVLPRTLPAPPAQREWKRVERKISV